MAERWLVWCTDNTTHTIRTSGLNPYAAHGLKALLLFVADEGLHDTPVHWRQLGIHTLVQRLLQSASWAFTGVASHDSADIARLERKSTPKNKAPVNTLTTFLRNAFHQHGGGWKRLVSNISRRIRRSSVLRGHVASKHSLRWAATPARPHHPSHGSHGRHIESVHGAFLCFSSGCPRAIGR